MKIIYNSILFKLPLLRNYNAIVLGRYCFTKFGKEHFSLITLQHEYVHQAQMSRDGVFMFYVIYLKDYLINLIKYRNHNQAYYNIPYEIEAYTNSFKQS